MFVIGLVGILVAPLPRHYPTGREPVRSRVLAALLRISTTLVTLAIAMIYIPRFGCIVGGTAQWIVISWVEVEHEGAAVRTGPDDYLPRANSGPRGRGPQSSTDRQSLADEAYWILRHAIVRGELRPNEALVEGTLGRRLGMSRTPIREALRRLRADRLIIEGARSFLVYEFTIDEITDIYECRAILESGAARLAATRRTSEQLATMSRILNQPARAGQSPREAMAEINEAFHTAIDDAANNPKLKEHIERNQLYYFSYPLASLYSDKEALASRSQHERLLKAIADHDAAAAEVIAREHVEDALSVIRVKHR